jgi:hypothetical protein
MDSQQRALIQALHDQGTAIDDIARRLRISARTVYYVLEKRQRQRQRKAADFDPQTEASPRCPTCGRKIKLPCRACETEKLGRRKYLLEHPEPGEEGLSAEQEQRRQEVLAARVPKQEVRIASDEDLGFFVDLEDVEREEAFSTQCGANPENQGIVALPINPDNRSNQEHHPHVE